MKAALWDGHSEVNGEPFETPDGFPIAVMVGENPPVQTETIFFVDPDTGMPWQDAARALEYGNEVATQQPATNAVSITGITVSSASDSVAEARAALQNVIDQLHSLLPIVVTLRADVDALMGAASAADAPGE